VWLMTRRQMRSTMTSGLALLAARGIASAGRFRQVADPNKWADPPGAESADVSRRISAATEQLDGGATVSELLVREDRADLRPYPRFREAIRAHTKGSTGAGPRRQKVPYQNPARS
jgi:hypothetical protein